MKHEFETVIEGLLKYINNNIYPGMNEFQEFASRVVVGRIANNTEGLKEMMINNGFVRTFGFIDQDGMVDVESVATDIKREIERQEKISFTIPMLGRYTFKPCDVDVLYKTITGEELTSADATNQEVY